MKKYCYVFSLSTMICASASAQQATVFVDSGSGNIAPPSGSNPGDSWTGTHPAFKFLQDGIERANQIRSAFPNASVEIWVAAGIYRPDESSTSPTGSGNRDASFQLRSNVAILGGKRD